MDLGDVKSGKVTINQSFQKRTGSENFRNEIIFNPNITCIIPRVIVFTQGKFPNQSPSVFIFWDVQQSSLGTRRRSRRGQVVDQV